MPSLNAYRRAFRYDLWGPPLTVCGIAEELDEANLLDLWRIVHQPVVLFHGEVRKLVSLALGMVDSGYSLKFANLPCDADTFVRKRGPEALGRSVAASVSLMDQLWSQTTEGRPRGSPRALMDIEAEMMRAIEPVPDERLWQRYAAEVGERVEGLRTRTVVRSNGNSNHSISPSSIRLGKVEKGLSLREAEIIARLASDPLGADVERLSVVQVSPETRKIITGISCLVGSVQADLLHQAIFQEYGPAIERAQQTLHKAGL